MKNIIMPGLVSITFRKLSPRQIVDLVVQSELRAIEWGGDIHVPHGDMACAAEARSMTEDAGLSVSAYGSYYKVGHSEQEGLSFETVLETAIRLNAPTVRVWAGQQASEISDESYQNMIVNESRRIADIAHCAGLTISFEYHSGTLTDTNASALRLLQSVDSPGIRSFWQPPNGRQADYCIAGLNAIVPWLTNLHIFHWTQPGNIRRPLAEGREIWRMYLTAAVTSGQNHFASIEFAADDDPKVFLSDAATLKEWLLENNL
jgi:sugar phosphate isomerase/epimerase